MAIPAKLVVRQATDILQDATSIRWPADELVRWLNAGQREIMLHRPDAFNKTAVIDCVPGTKQSIPSDGAKLIEVQRNGGSAPFAVRLCEREILDAQMPGWHTVTPAQRIVHFMYDPREPRSFWVYPPAAAGATLEINYSASPAEITAPASGANYDAVTGNLAVNDIYANALLDYILYRAFSKDAEYAGNATRGVAHYSAFANALGIEIKATMGVAPTSRGNPNASRATAQQG